MCPAAVYDQHLRHGVKQRVVETDLTLLLNSRVWHSTVQIRAVQSEGSRELLKIMHNTVVNRYLRARVVELIAWHLNLRIVRTARGAGTREDDACGCWAHCCGPTIHSPFCH